MNHPKKKKPPRKPPPKPPTAGEQIAISFILVEYGIGVTPHALRRLAKWRELKNLARQIDTLTKRAYAKGFADGNCGVGSKLDMSDPT